MATQDTHSIRFTHTSPQNNFRLLELPPDLLEELSSDKAQTYVFSFCLFHEVAASSRLFMGWMVNMMRLRVDCT